MPSPTKSACSVWEGHWHLQFSLRLEVCESGHRYSNRRSREYQTKHSLPKEKKIDAITNNITYSAFILHYTIQNKHACTVPYKCTDVHIHTKTVIPCSLHSIATAQSRRLTITHDTENFSVLSPAKQRQKSTASIILRITEYSGKANKSAVSPPFHSPWNALQYERKESWKNRAHKRSARPTMPATYSKHRGQHHTLKRLLKDNTSYLRTVFVWEYSVVRYIKQTAI